MNIKFACLLVMTVGFVMVTPATYARDDIKQMSIADAMNSADAKDKLNSNVQVYWSTQSHPRVAQKYGTFTSNKKTSFFGKSDEVGCERAFLSAVIAMQARAVEEGGNAVIDLHSVYKNHEFESATQYECGAGSIMGGVALRGTVARIR